MEIKSRVVKFISSLLIVAILAPTFLFTIPEQANAQWVVTDPGNTSVSTLNKIGTWLVAAATGSTAASSASNTAMHWQDILKEIARQLIMAAEKKLLQKMTQATVNWINSGFHGSPLFLQDPGSFFKDIGKSEIKTAINLIGYDPNQPFGESYALSIINAYKRQLATNLQYSMSKVMTDTTYMNTCRSSFNGCGWYGFLTNTQYPQNNYLGYTMLVNNELSNKLRGTVQNAAQKVQTTLNQGMGFLSPKNCPSNPAYNNGTNEFVKPVFQPTVTYDPPYKTQDQIDESSDPAAAQAKQDAYTAIYKQTSVSEKAVWNDPNGPNVCPGGLKATTPGSVVANQITMAMGSTFRQSELGAALGNSIGAILDALLNHFLDQGLSAMGGLISGTPSIDNFSYIGQTLSLASTPAVDNSSLTANPSSLSVDDSGIINTTISGGTMPYSIQTPPDAAVATAEIIGSGLIISSNKPGSTLVTVKDSSIPAKTVDIQIKVGASSGTGDPIGTCNDFNGIENLTEAVCTTIGGTWTTGTTNIPPVVVTPPTMAASPRTISVETGSEDSAVVYNGMAPFSIVGTPPDDTIATVALRDIGGDLGVSITGVAPGSTSVTIQDSSTPTPQTVTIDITVEISLTTTPLGTCTQGTTATQMPQAVCESVGGKWTP